jgi:hypothetical protein
MLLGVLPRRGELERPTQDGDEHQHERKQRQRQVVGDRRGELRPFVLAEALVGGEHPADEAS